VAKKIHRIQTENPEDEADLDFGDELVDGPERLLEGHFDLVSPLLFVEVDRLIEHVAGDRGVDGHGARLTLEAERGQRQQDQEADVRQRVRDELGRRTPDGVTDLPQTSSGAYLYIRQHSTVHKSKAEAKVPNS